MTTLLLKFIFRSLYLHKDFEGLKVNTIVTLATPHRPVIIADRELHKFYEDVNRFWKLNADSELQHVTLIAIGGGFRDIQVKAYLHEI
jgi:hypothetical protein